MTLVVAIPAENSVVVASDSQATMGMVKRPGDTKIFRLGSHIVWGAAGNLSVIQKIEQNLLTLGTISSLKANKDRIEGAVWMAFRAVLASDVRSTAAMPNYSELMAQYGSGIVLAEANPNPEMLTVHGQGGSTWAVNGPAAIGSGEVLAMATFAKYAGAKLTEDQAKLLAYKTIHEAISVAAYGLGHPIDVWLTNATGFHQLDRQELMRLGDDDRVLREAEINLLKTSNTSA